MQPFFPPLSIACLYSISQDSCCFHLEAKPWISASVLTFGRFLHGTIQTFHLIFMDTVMYMCCMNHSIRLDRMKNSFEYITLSYLSGGISFSNIHRSFVLTCIRKHQKKILYWQCARSKRGMQYPCNLSMIFEYPLFQTPERNETSQKKHPASLHTPWSTMLIVCYIHLFFDAYASSSSNG